MFFRIGLIATISVLVLIFVTQVLWPLLRGRPLFPIFRKQTSLEMAITKERQRLHEEGLESHLSDLKKTSHKGSNPENDTIIDLGSDVATPSEEKSS